MLRIIKCLQIIWILLFLDQVIINENQQLQRTLANMKLKVELDIQRINNPKEFDQTLTHDNLIQNLLFSQKQNEEHIEVLKAISVQMGSLKYKWLYVGFKWLIFLHQCLNQISEKGLTSLSTSTILGFLNKIQNPKCWTKHEEYLSKKLFVPYLQYLIKLASIIEIKFQGASLRQNYIFLELNLLRFAIAQFTHPIREFNKYFKQCYPSLSRCFCLISQQVYRIHKRVAIHYQMKQLKQMHFIEVDQLSESLVFFPTQIQKFPKSNSTVASSDVHKNKGSPILFKKISNFPDMQSTSMVLNS